MMPLSSIVQPWKERAIFIQWMKRVRGSVCNWACVRLYLLLVQMHPRACYTNDKECTCMERVSTFGFIVSLFCLQQKERQSKWLLGRAFSRLTVETQKEQVENKPEPSVWRNGKMSVFCLFQSHRNNDMQIISFNDNSQDNDLRIFAGTDC